MEDLGRIEDDYDARIKVAMRNVALSEGENKFGFGAADASVVSESSDEEEEDDDDLSDGALVRPCALMSLLSDVCQNVEKKIWFYRPPPTLLSHAPRR